MTQSAGSSAKRRVLVVEDERLVRHVICLHLSLAGFDVTEVDEGLRALELARSTAFHAIILDVMLPGIDGITICRAVRAGGPNIQTPILMLTGNDTETDKVLGLESGADDYMTKPFGVREWRARVDAILRRSMRHDEPRASTPGRLDARDLTLDAERREAVVRGRRVELTKQEFDVLYLLAARPGIVFSREALLANVWGGDTFVEGRTVDAVVSRLRRKIERDAHNPRLILTAWGIGYKFVDAD